MNTIAQVTRVTQVTLPQFEYQVELVSLEVEEEFDGEYVYGIPVEFRIIDVLVDSNNEATIVSRVKELGYLDQYEIIRYWSVEELAEEIELEF